MSGAVADGDAREIEAGPSTSSGRTDSGVSPGHTLLIGEEQLYVREARGGTLVVDRGVNGTGASAHEAGTAVYVIEYPGPVVEATLVQTARLWRLASGGDPDGRAVLNGDMRTLLGSYRKQALGVGC